MSAASSKPAAHAKPLWMRVCLFASGGLLAVVVLFLIIGMLLPSSYRVERTTVIDATRAEVHATIADLTTWDEWTAWTPEAYPSLKYEYEGAESGMGAVQTWQAHEGDGRLEITRSDPESGIAYELTWADHPPMRGRINLVAIEAGTKVTWIVEGPLGGSPINRWFGLMMDSLLGPDHEKGLEGLKARLE